jgi:hypothetical protein
MDIGTQGPELHARVVNHTGMFEAPKVSLVGWTVIDTNSCPCPQLLKTRSKATATMRATALNHFLFMKDSWILRLG